MGCCNVKISVKKEPVKLDIKTNIAVTGKQSYPTTVDLSMSEGDQVITPNEGRVFSKVTVKKPDTMVPENIRKGTDIGGVVGTMTPPQPDMLQQLVDLTGKLTGLNNNSTVTNYDFLENLDTSKVKSFASMFEGDSALERAPESWDTSNVTTFSRLFFGNKSLKNAPEFWNTSNVTGFSYCFYMNNINNSFLKLPNWDYSKGTNFGYFTHYLSTNVDITLNIPNAITIQDGFSGSKLNNINLITSEKLRNLNYCFWNATINGNLNISNTENVTEVHHMFGGATIDILPNFDFKNVTTAESFINQSKVRVVPNIFGNKVTTFYQFATYNSTLEDCELDMLSCINSSRIFYGCTNLTNLKLHNIKINTTIGSGTFYGTKLTQESLIFCIKELWSYKDTTTTRTLIMSTASKTLIADVYVKLITPTQEQIEEDPYINNKLPCEVCESTDEGAMTITAYANLKNWTIA